MPDMRGAVTVPCLFMTDGGGEICDELLHGMTFRVIESLDGEKSENGGYHIETEYGYRGNIPAEGIRLFKTGEIADTRGLCLVYGGIADVTATPSARGTVIKTLVRGSAVRALSEGENGYTGIELADGARGFIRSAFLRPREEEGGLREAVLAAAYGYLGAQYRWGGKSPLGIDCSGLCFMAYYLNGITVFRDARIEPGYAVRRIPRGEMGVADLAFLPGHVAMYAGGGRFIHSSVGNSGVAVDRLQGYPAGEMTAGSVF